MKKLVVTVMAFTFMLASVNVMAQDDNTKTDNKVKTETTEKKCCKADANKKCDKAAAASTDKKCDKAANAEKKSCDKAVNAEQKSCCSKDAEKKG